LLIRKLALLLCVVTASWMTAAASSIPFNGSGSSGTIPPGQPFAYDFDHASQEPDWGIPGVGGTLSVWTGPVIGQFTITFDLPQGVIIDPMNLGGNCNGGPMGGTVFCASPYSQPWNVTALTSDSITFTAQPGGDLLINRDPFFVNIFFSGGDPNGASFNGAWVTAVPEPGSLILFGTGTLGAAALMRRKIKR
jgi:hypothetical protein